MNKQNEHIAPELIAAYLSQQISSEDSNIVRNWIDSSSENLKYFEQIKAVWIETGKLIPSPVDVNVDEAWNKISGIIGSIDQKNLEIRRTQKWQILSKKSLFRAAAIFLPIIAFTAIYLFLNNEPKILTYQSLAQSIQDTLSDGSIVSLNNHSTLRYPAKFNGNTREVEMNGEVFFEIKPNKEKPFIIHTENAIIKVLGTSFNVKSYNDSSRIEVDVETGRVMFSEIIIGSSDTISIVLEAGDKGIYDKPSHKLWKTNDQEITDLFWKNKTLIFNRTELLNVANSLEENYGITIDFKEESIENLHFSTTFKNQDIDAIMNIIANTFDLKISKDGTKYILDKNE